MSRYQTQMHTWIIGDLVIHPPTAYRNIEDWLAIVREKIPEWEPAFVMRERELKQGVKWNKLTQALVMKIFTRLTEMELAADEEHDNE